jgi:hypothetical protein
MIDDKLISTIERIEQRLEEIETVVKLLDEAIENYQQWMAQNRYTKATRQAYARSLKQFRVFIKQRKCSFEQIFTYDTLTDFKQLTKSFRLHAIYGLSRYLLITKRYLSHYHPKAPRYSYRKSMKTIFSIINTAGSGPMATSGVSEEFFVLLMITYTNNKSTFFVLPSNMWMSF